MRRCAILLTLAVLTALTHAAEPVKRVACDSGLVMELHRIRGTGARSPRRTPGDGIVHPKASVAKLRNVKPAILVAIDAADPDAKVLDLLRFDFSGTGRFAGKPVVKIKGNLTTKRWIQRGFDPVTLKVTRGKRTIPVTIKGSYTRSSNNDHGLYLQFGTALESACDFGGKRRKVRLVDGNANLNCTDKAAPARNSEGINRHDTVVVYGDGEPVKGYYGHPVLVDGVWYDVALTADGKTIAAKPTTAKMSMLKISQQDWDARLIGSRHILNIQGSTKPVAIPADRYTVKMFRQRSAPDAKGRTTSFDLTWVQSRGKPYRTFQADAGKTVQVTIGAPLTTRINATVDGRTVNLTLNVTDVSGAPVGRVVLPGGNWAKPKFRILDEKAKTVLSASLGFS